MERRLDEEHQRMLKESSDRAQNLSLMDGRKMDEIRRREEERHHRHQELQMRRELRDKIAHDSLERQIQIMEEKSMFIFANDMCIIVVRKNEEKMRLAL